MAPESSFHFEIEESQDKHSLPVTIFKCHGRMLGGQDAAKLKNAVRPLTESGAQHVVIDLNDLETLDSSGLGALVGMKVSSVNRGLGKLDIINLSPRVRELLKITHLTDLFAS